MKTIIIFTVVLIATPFIAAAQIAPVEGIGRVQCKYLEAVDFTTQASIGQWLLGYYSGALAMNMSFSMAQGLKSDIPARSKLWNDENLLESARANCAIYPDLRLYQVANQVVTMVIDD